MKFAIVLAVLFAVAFARPQSPESQATISKSSNEISGDHSQYQYAVETSNGISAQANGQLRQPKSADASPSYETHGEYSYTGPDGILYTITYTADEFGMSFLLYFKTFSNNT